MIKNLLALAILGSIASVTHAQTVNCNSARGTVAIPGTLLTVTCPSAPAPAPAPSPPPPPPPPPPITGCSASQSTIIGGKVFQRQCNGFATMYPNGIVYNGDFTDLSPILGNKQFPNYLYSGQSPTFTVTSGYYVSLGFTPQSSGLIKFTANNSYGDGGTISLSTVPGALTQNAPGAICVSPYGGLNSMLISTTSGTCKVSIGQTYYINFADTNTNGDFLCFGGVANTCAESRMSFAFTARSQ